MDALRKVYHRAVQIPLENVEVLWKDYESFENGLNKITVRDDAGRARRQPIPMTERDVRACRCRGRLAACPAMIQHNEMS